MSVKISSWLARLTRGDGDRAGSLWRMAVLALAAFGIGFAAGAQTGPVTGSVAPPPRGNADSAKPLAPLPGGLARPPTSQGEISLSFAPVVKATAPAVVNLYAKRIERRRRSASLFDQFYNLDTPGQTFETTRSSLGSGVIVRAEGIIVTNAHVVEDATEIRVVLSDRREYDARILVSDPRTDLAVLRVDPGADRLPVLAFADTRRTEVGDLVMAIGNPFGVGQTVTQGIISATSRTELGRNEQGPAPGGFGAFASFLQTDAAINPGNSGGALVNLAGELVGINSAILTRDGDSAGVGFAIPAELVRRILDSALADGRVVRTWLGVKAQKVTPAVARSLGLSAPQGVIAESLFPGGPAANAGVKRGDVILAVDSRPIFDESGLRFAAETKKPGEKVRLDILRIGKRQILEARVAALPSAPDDRRVLNGSHPFAGAEVYTLSAQDADERGLDPFSTPVVIRRVTPRSFAAALALRSGDVIQEINGTEIHSTAELSRILESAPAIWRLAILRDGALLRRDFDASLFSRGVQ